MTISYDAPSQEKPLHQEHEGLNGWLGRGLHSIEEDEGVVLDMPAMPFPPDEMWMGAASMGTGQVLESAVW
jgi:hypothetical protein